MNVNVCFLINNLAKVAKRQGLAISPKELDGLLGETFNQDLIDDTAISMKHFRSKIE